MRRLDFFLLRAMLFVPVNRPRFVEKAPSVGADAIILDLEDSVADANKPRLAGCSATALPV